MYGVVFRPAGSCPEPPRAGNMFPPEIIDHILSFLQWDHATLKVCARAHPLLSSLVNKHFYRHLTVQNDDHHLFKRIVDPNIANLVRNLQIIVNHFCDYQALESILPMLTQLRAISLSSTTGFFHDLSESFRTAFTNCLRLPTLTHVKLRDFHGFPLSALDHSSSLKRLSLWGNVRYIPPASPLVYPPLEFLDLSNCSSNSMETIAPWVNSRGVHSLRLSRSLGHSSRLLEVCANTLTILHVDVPSHYYDTPIPLSLSCLPHLGQLTVRTPISFNWSIESCLPSTMRFLDTLPSPLTNLLLLVISVDITISDPDDNYDTDWSPLISFPYFDVIPRVELRVRAQRVGTLISSAELLHTLKRNPHLIQLEGHRSFQMSVVEELDDGSLFPFVSD